VRRGPGKDRVASVEKRRNVGVGTLLVALVLIPLSGMTMLGVSMISTRRTTVEHSRHVQESLSRIDALIALREALHYEQTAADARLRAAQLGMTPAQAGVVFGFAGDVHAARARSATDMALASFGQTIMPMGVMPSTAPPTDVAALRRLRAAVDSGAISPADAERDYDALDAQAENSLRSLLDELASMTGRIDQGSLVWDALEALHAASDGLGAGASEVNAMTALSLDSGSAGQLERTLADLGHATALYEQARDRFHDAGVPGSSNDWTAIENNPAIARYSEALAVAEADPPATADGYRRGRAAVLAEIGGGLRRDQLLFGLVARSSAKVHSTATELVSAATAQYRDWTIGLVALALTTILVALALARFITRPIRRLAELARAVSGGSLDVKHGPTAGPKETGVVARAFDDLVSNLRLLESKSRALANCDFGDPSLSEPLPGQLGRSIESSVQTLSGSIEEREKLQHRLADQATHDALTGLYNRAAALNALEHSLARTRRTGDVVGLLYVDLDDFKRANDTHGHQVGDQILKDVAARMRDVVRGGDLLARLGGDEFLVIAERIGDAVEAAALARRLIDAVAFPTEHEGLHFSVGASVGIALALDNVDDPGQLLARADMALYRAKQGGRANIEIFDKSLQDELTHRTDVEQALAAALAEGSSELVLHYQPVIDSGDGHLTALEALVRWQRPGSGLLPPGEFIPVAEASDLIIDLDFWVMRRVAAQIAAWHEQPELNGVVVAVNISGRHLLSQQLDTHLQTVIDDTGVDPRRLIFEITETVLVSDLPTAADELEKIRARGVRIAIDDFGTGYTSISHLQRLPVDTIKIDRSFVSQVDQPRDQSLVRMVTDLSHHMGVNVVAEGVETSAQRKVLQGLGCDSLQGFLISRPIPAGEIQAWIRGRREERTQIGPR
jgi:diguanylate cyclase (GGDEF)-like protein